jgi:hypothetical protein
MKQTPLQHEVASREHPAPGGRQQPHVLRSRIWGAGQSATHAPPQSSVSAGQMHAPAWQI